MLVQLTNAGAALLNANAGPINLSSYKLGSAFNYVPSPTDTDIHGTLVLSGAPSAFAVMSANVVKYSVYLDYPLGPFSFGELGLYTSGGVLFALAASSALIQKLQLTSTTAGNSMRLDIYLSMVGQNYEMWLDYAESDNQFAMAVLGSADQLPQPQNAVPNAYIISGASSSQSAYLAYTDRQGLWNFDAYAYANQAAATITGFTSQSVTIALSQYVPGMSPQYEGEVICEFSTGQLYGICRYVSTVVTSAGNVTLGFYNPLMMTPAIGDKIIVFARQSLSTTIPNLPIATRSSLGGVIVGNTLTVTTNGLLNVDTTQYPVQSVNGQTGAVVLTASNISGLATVATTGSYNDLLNKPTPYTLPAATTTTLGGVKGPTNGHLTLAADGTLDIGFAPVLSVNTIVPDATGNVTLPVPPAPIGLVAPTAIASATDFNTLKTTGMYFALDSVASTLINAPTTAVGGVLDIEPFTTTASGGDVIQRYTTATSIYFRRYQSGSSTWTTWIQVANTVSMPIATTSTIGGVIIGSGLSVTGLGVLSTVIQSINGHATANVVLTAADVNAVPVSYLGAQGGVPQLDQGTSNPATDAYTYGRMLFYQNTLGTWWNAGKWDASANHVIQSHTGNSTIDANTSLASGGLQTIDISYNGQNRNITTVPDYQQVNAEGAVYQVSVAGSTNLDGYSTWNVGDLAVCINGKWTQIIVNFGPVVFSAGTF